MAQEESDTDEVQEMLQLAGRYEKHAIGTQTSVPRLNEALSMVPFQRVCVCVAGVFSECHRNDEKRAQMLLVRVSAHWGGTACLQLALEANDQDFVAQSGVQVGNIKGN